MIRADIQLQAETVEELQAALRLLANFIDGSCKLDEPEGEHHYTGEDDAAIITAHFKVLPEYREGDLAKFIGCAPNATGDLTTEEFIDKIRGG
jgi:hypothetical protein